MHHGVNKEIEGIPLAILSRILAQSRVIPLPELCMEELRSIANGDFYDISHGVSHPYYYTSRILNAATRMRRLAQFRRIRARIYMYYSRSYIWLLSYPALIL